MAGHEALRNFLRIAEVEGLDLHHQHIEVRFVRQRAPLTMSRGKPALQGRHRKQRVRRSRWTRLDTQAVHRVMARGATTR